MARIVVGAERSPEGVAAVEWALEEAVRRNLPLLVVRAWSDPVTVGYPLSGVLVASAEEAEAEAARTAADVVKEAGENVVGADGVDVQVVALRGSAGPVLARAAEGADLLVVGTRSASAVARALLGSVSVHVLRHATCPVAVVPAPQPTDSRPGRVLVGVDHASSSAALRWAADEAERRDAVLVPVLAREAAWKAVKGEDLEPMSLRQLEASERRALQALVPADTGVAVEPEILVGHPGKALVHLAAPQDVLVVGHRRRRGPVGTLLGSTGVYVAEHGSCPVVVVRESAT